MKAINVINLLGIMPRMCKAVIKAEVRAQANTFSIIFTKACDLNKTIKHFSLHFLKIIKFINKTLFDFLLSD